MSKKNSENPGQKFQDLVNIMAKLRGPDGCPWDKEQTHETLRQYLLEETYEVLEALDQKNHKNLKEELGDLLLQVLFHAQIASEEDNFNISDVIKAISDKLIRRHPNVFGNLKISSAKEQSVNWEKLKKKEGKSSTIDGVPKTLSALLRAWRIQQKAATVGFDWPNEEPVWEKIHEEIEELKNVSENGTKERLEDEFGDLVFSLVNISRFIGVNPEDALRKSTEKFSERFKQMETHFQSNKKSLSGATLKEMDAVWEEIKKGEGR